MSLLLVDRIFVTSFKKDYLFYLLLNVAPHKIAWQFFFKKLTQALLKSMGKFFTFT